MACGLPTAELSVSIIFMLGRPNLKVLQIRGTPDEQKRVDATRKDLPAGLFGVVATSNRKPSVKELQLLGLPHVSGSLTF
jgi:hypothetical protein